MSEINSLPDLSETWYQRQDAFNMWAHRVMGPVHGPMSPVRAYVAHWNINNILIHWEKI